MLLHALARQRRRVRASREGERTHEAFWEWFEGLIALRADPREALEATFDGVAKLASSPQCLGCAFVGASVEFPPLDNLGHRVALAHKNAVLERFRGLAQAAGARDPTGLAEELLLLMDGAWSAARVFGAGSHASRVSEAASELIAGHLDRGQPREVKRARPAGP